MNRRELGMVFLLCSCVLVGIGRFMVPGHGLSWPGTYEAFAHILVGMLICLGCIGQYKEDRVFAWIALAVLTALETVMFLLRGNQ